jgi:hypothetical protein
MSATNSSLLQEPPAETHGGKVSLADKAASAPNGLPPFRPLAVTAFAANVPVLSWLLLTGHLANALSLLGGFGVGIVLYGSLHLFVGRALEPLFAGLRGQAKPNIGGAKTLFVALLPLKYLVIGGLMFLLIRGGHLSILWFAVGFVFTQVSITAATVLHLARQRH